ncbi:amidohydrolase family protein [Oscillospiraceae bacterium MB08-C2-2]|nr:amidohydrolase family protein [Oscillospiraceae bacterium MB08-C2-2]
MYDLAILNGILIDPEAGRLIPANLYCRDGKIAEISREVHEATQTLDAKGDYISPGFIDIHAHIEGSAYPGSLLALQGVTTVINGNCGLGLADLPSFFEEQNRKGFILNQLELSGASTLRERAGLQDRYAPLSPAQLEQACGMLREDLEAGAAGLSFGLEYMPGSSREEVLALSRVAARYGKPVTIHTRTDCFTGLAALQEAIDISRFTGAGVQISHVVYQYGFGMMKLALAMIDDAVKSGLDISCDSGMYTSFATAIGSAVFDEGCLEKWRCGYDAILAATGKYAGQRLNRDTFEELRRETPSETAIALIGNPHEILMAFDLPYMMISSDCGVNKEPDPSYGHPQDAGTFPRFIRQLVRKTGRLTLADAVARATILPAKRMDLDVKGRITPGSDADLVIFSLDELTDRSQFPHLGSPAAPPEGIRAVAIAGKITVENGVISGENPGKAVLSPNRIWHYTA